MFRAQVVDRALRDLRFWYSPLTETLASLQFLDEPAGLPGQRRWQRAARVQLRTAPAPYEDLLRFLAPAVGAIPDFLDPPPRQDAFPAGEPFEAELDRMLSDAAGRALDEVCEVAAGKPAVAMPGRRVPPTVRRVLDRGEGALLDTVGEALRRHWRVAVRPLWRTVHESLERDLDHRAGRAARGGSDATLAGLHPGVAFDGRVLLLDKPYHEHFAGVDRLLLTPSAFGSTRLRLARHGRRGLRIFYPAYGSGPAWEPPPRPPRVLADLLGATRAELLADLAAPATTTALAERHRLSAATVSHHLGVLHRAGLVGRHRHGKRVLYARTAWAGELVDGPPGAR
jgi:DNA-binding transcriptional ArsR family regulator